MAAQPEESLTAAEGEDYERSTFLSWHPHRKVHVVLFREGVPLPIPYTFILTDGGDQLTDKQYEEFQSYILYTNNEKINDEMMVIPDNEPHTPQYRLAHLESSANAGIVSMRSG